MTTPAPEHQARGAPQASASELRAEYQRAQAEANAAREISTDIGTPAGERAMSLSYAATIAYDKYKTAWGREQQREADRPRPEAEPEAEAEA